MGFDNKKIKPSNDLYTLLAPVVFDSIRSSEEHTSSRTRQCYKCMNKIEKSEKYIMHQFRYDKKIIALSFHKDCFNGC